MAWCYQATSHHRANIDNDPGCHTVSPGENESIYQVCESEMTNMDQYVTPLGLPRSVCKSGVECRLLSRNGQMSLKVKVNDPHFQ